MVSDAAAMPGVAHTYGLDATDGPPVHLPERSGLTGSPASGMWGG